MDPNIDLGSKYCDFPVLPDRTIFLNPQILEVCAPGDPDLPLYKPCAFRCFAFHQAASFPSWIFLVNAVFWGIGACLAGIILAWAIPIQAFTPVGRNWFPIIYVTAAGCLIGFGIFIASYLLGTKEYRHHLTQKRRTRWEIIYYAFPMILVGVIYLLSFWPVV